jgi:hypothetical protein
MPVQRVRRVIRKVDPWTVLKVSLIFNAVMALATVLGTVIFWAVFVNAGIPERVNDWAVLIGIENGITFDGAIYFRMVALLAVVGVVMMTGLFTLAAVVYNLISDLVGGIELVILEETIGPQTPQPKVSLPIASSRTGRRASAVAQAPTGGTPSPQASAPLAGDGGPAIPSPNSDIAPPPVE